MILFALVVCLSYTGQEKKIYQKSSLETPSWASRRFKYWFTVINSCHNVHSA